MGPKNIQLQLGDKCITVRIEVFSGVLTERTFTGENCYPQLLDYLRQVGFKDNLQAEIGVD
ncbi:MAG: hypothetical protein WBX81_08120 [Nitrososphaeraceae archaeon]